MKLTKTLDLLARPTRFELVTLGLEMRWNEYTNDLVLHRFVILQCAYENGLKTHLLILQNCYEKEMKIPHRLVCNQ